FAVGPLGWDVIRCVLDPHPGLPVHQDAVPVVIALDRTPQHLGPEAALRRDVRCVEDDHLLLDLHGASFPPRSSRVMRFAHRLAASAKLGAVRAVSWMERFQVPLFLGALAGGAALGLAAPELARPLAVMVDPA